MPRRGHDDRSVPDIDDYFGTMMDRRQSRHRRRRLGRHPGWWAVIARYGTDALVVVDEDLRRDFHRHY